MLELCPNIFARMKKKGQNFKQLPMNSRGVLIRYDYNVFFVTTGDFKGTMKDYRKCVYNITPIYVYILLYLYVLHKAWYELYSLHKTHLVDNKIRGLLV